MTAQRKAPSHLQHLSRVKAFAVEGIPKKGIRLRLSETGTLLQ